MLQHTMTNTLEINNKSRMPQQRKHLAREIENIKNNRMEILEINHLITKIKRSGDEKVSEWAQQQNEVIRKIDQGLEV